jgi:hypothetical protein
MLTATETQDSGGDVGIPRGGSIDHGDSEILEGELCIDESSAKSL